MEHVTCCVVGGGPAGMMLSVLLARAGVKVAVLEKHQDFLRDFRGDTVHPSTLRLLDELGLGDRFAALPHRKLEQMRMRIGDETVVAADFGRLRGRHKYIAMVPQWDFLDLLAGSEKLDLRMGTEVTGLRRIGGRVTGVTYRDENGTGELTADLVVACDGRDSVVRRAAGLKPREFPMPMDVWQVRVPAPSHAERDGRVFGVFTRGQAAVTMDRGDYHQTSYLIRKGEDAALRTRDIEWFRRQLAELFGWDREVLAAIRSWDDVKLLETSMGRLPRWYTDGLLCLGDAAHTMSPVGGVGVNLAVQDAVAAARILAGPLAAGTASTSDLAKVQKRREFPMRVAQRSQLGEHDMLLRPALDGTLNGVPGPLRMVQRFPALAGVTAYVGGIGVRPEHAPAFARR
ncbi:FAD-dependent oxidoreductase [Amycolatopsis granulosa]|uniref:FAD-dependent oxidoreductase n=1 Tax=Amycolatopsis granulosa TaxID=185684 RepID=UPI00141EFF73|nr:FAD-dependent oxidoreductase [Amycolatopsis granulosa]NIH87454.1 2-polyprenyl-6-methoxyphenol hydroxylase-like FAD-dependent oxidoreductase [Amycolatopsis granulosa]